MAQAFQHDQRLLCKPETRNRREWESLFEAITPFHQWKNYTLCRPTTKSKTLSAPITTFLNLTATIRWFKTLLSEERRVTSLDPKMLCSPLGLHQFRPKLMSEVEPKTKRKSRLPSPHFTFKAKRNKQFTNETVATKTYHKNISKFVCAGHGVKIK